MMDFRKLTIKDKSLVQGFTLNSTRRNCDLSFTNLCSWSFLYNTHFAVMNDYLVLRFSSEGQTAYMMPVGQGDLKPVLEAMLADAVTIGEPFRMLGVSPRMRADLETEMPDTFAFESNRDYADYIYLRTDLATLKGKKLQAKRNHVNKFMRTYPEYGYYEIKPEYVPECLALERQWEKRNMTQEEANALEAERRSLTYALNHFEQLDLCGGVLCVNGRMAAFTFGAAINSFTFDVCIEKADTEIDGAYAMINYEFSRRLPEQYMYINREEDLGLEGLRKAKLSYHPDELLEKYIVTLL